MNILVTGISRGIGAGICAALREQGHNVIGVSRTLTFVEGDIQGDLTKGLGSIFNRANVKLGHIDVLINNAGVCTELDIVDTDFEVWQQAWEDMMKINFFPAVHLTRLCVRAALVHGRPLRVINMCSRVAFKGQADAPHYAASKAALLNFTRSMAIRYAATNLLFFSVSPCWVDTDMATGTHEEMTRDIPAKRIASVDDVVAAVSFFVNNATPFMTGSNIDVNGASYFH